MKTLKKQYDDLEIVSQRMEEQYKTMDQAYREEIKQIVKALDNQFDARIFDWERKAKELSEKEENFLEVNRGVAVLSATIILKPVLKYFSESIETERRAASIDR